MHIGLNIRTISGGLRYFWNGTDQSLGKSVSQSRIVRQIKRIDIFSVRILPRHRPLLPGVAAYKDYKSQAHNQSHRLDGGVELVAG